ncbi:MAG: UvrD-helicase domain-containing protein [Christensenellaceae bacterium]|jgi:ATP-dependent helicase/nuclease subunit A|nr:UvrD-helicase domain-containing protein [Christensenellaceae bacterium]
MSAMQWTPAQRRAIEAGGNLLVSAAAGSGKTAVLTERIARLVCEGCDIDALLVVTFTRAAAAEMKKRIAARLCALAEEAEDTALSARLLHAAAGMGRANISTIDAFCTHVLKRHFHTAGLDPAFRAAEEAEAEALRAQTMDTLLEESYAAPSFQALVELFPSEEAFIENVFRLYAFLCAQPNREGWLQTAIEAYALPEAELAQAPALRAYVEAAQRAVAARVDALSTLRDAAAEAGYTTVAQTLDAELAQLRALLLPAEYAVYAARLASVGFGRLTWPRGTAEGEKDAIKAARTAVKELVKEQSAAFQTPLGEHAALLHALHPHMRALGDFMLRFDALYAEAKREAGLIDYADMEHLALMLLQNAAIAAEYQTKFRYVFVDEYQDINPVQECILNALRREDNLFLVGDVKQSIYRFRMAEPGIFMEKRRAFAGEAGENIDLNANFRSADAVIGTVNAVFSQAMHEEVGGIAYDADAALAKGRADALIGRAELHIIEQQAQPAADSKDDDQEAGALTQLQAAEAEARVAAARIRSLVGEPYADPRTGAVRPLRYSDIVVLHGAPKRVAELWVQTLAREGVPAFAEVTGGYFDAVEVQVLLNLLRLLDNRRQDIPLLSVLRSPIGGWETEELISLRADYPALSCYESLLACAAYDTPLGAKAAGFLQKLEAWQNQAALRALPDLVALLLSSTGYARFVRALPGGAARKGNLDALVQSAETYARSGHGLAGFLRFMDRIKDTGRMGTAQVGSADVVRVLSIHKSKGLEFPVVILAGLHRQFNAADRHAELVMDAALGLGIKPILRNTRRATLYHAGIAAQGWLMNVAEQTRVLYVGMTRAADQLILLCAVRDIDAALKKHIVPLSPARSAAATRFSDWVLGSALHMPAGNAARERLGLLPLMGEPALQVYLHEGVRKGGQSGVLPQEAYRAFTIRKKEGDPRLEAALRWQYSHLEDTRLPSRVSVSGLSGEAPALPQYPAFLQDKLPPDAAERGTAAHLLLQRVPFAPHDAQTLRAEVEALVQTGALTRAQASTIYLPGILKFFAGGIWSRALAAARRERELEFNCRLPACAVLPGVQSNETVLLQGVIDCCFMEEGQWVLLDYKTDFVPPGANAARVARRHARQLELYALSLERMTGCAVKEKYIVLLRTGEVVEI